MKKIALIMDGWKRFFTYAWPAGVLERIRETNEDVNLYISTVLETGAGMRITISESTTSIGCRT